ncbi:MAG TPA: hypothetical protein VNJ51_15425 [Candidatus Dormibacteraeota bacterium]|nr:hypothetical protein [Candidatus Dormibacteraeota bacterium]
MKNSALLCMVLLAAMTIDVRASEPTRPPVPALVLRAAAVYAVNVRGVIGMQRHFSTVLHAGPIHHTEESDSGYLMKDGSFVKIKYVRIADDGKAFSAKQIAQRDAQTNQDWTVGKIFFKEPYDPRFVRDYVFDSPTACTACPKGTVAVIFGSSIQDTQHGSGTMWIELATGRVDRLTYIPNVLPPHATFGTVTEISGWAMPNVWYVTRIDGAYRGKAFVVSGTGTFTGVFDHFRRFSTVAKGEAALRAGTI